MVAKTFNGYRRSHLVREFRIDLSNEELSPALFEVYQPGEDAVLTFLQQLEPQLLSYIDIYSLQRSTL